MVEFGNCLVEPISNIENSKPCGIRAARKLRVVRRQERWADKVISSGTSKLCCRSTRRDTTSLPLRPMCSEELPWPRELSSRRCTCLEVWSDA